MFKIAHNQNKNHIEQYRHLLGVRYKTFIFNKIFLY